MKNKVKPILYAFCILAFAATMAFAYSFDSLLKGDITGARGIFTTTLRMSSGVASHNYASGNDTWTLSDQENYATTLFPTNAGKAMDVIAKATAGKILCMYNASGFTLTVKALGQSGKGIATSKSACLVGNGTDFVRLTSDQTY